VLLQGGFEGSPVEGPPLERWGTLRFTSPTVNRRATQQWHLGSTLPAGSGGHTTLYRRAHYTIMVVCNRSGAAAIGISHAVYNHRGHYEVRCAETRISLERHTGNAGGTARLSKTPPDSDSVTATQYWGIVLRREVGPP